MSNYLSPSQDGGKKRTNQLNDTNRKKKETSTLMIPGGTGPVIRAFVSLSPSTSPSIVLRAQRLRC